jgi:drug/metabolite transporter (DMT)-like permease
MSAASTSTSVSAAAGGAVACIIVGSSFAVSAEVVDLPLASTQAVRYALAGAILTLLLRGRLGRLSSADHLRLVGVAFFGMVAFNVLIVAAVDRADPSTVGVVVGCAPLVLALVGPLAEGRRPDAALLAAATVVVAGAALVQGVGDAGGAGGLALALVILACEVLFSVLAAPVLARIGPARLSARACWLATAMLLPGALLFEGEAVPAASGSQLAAIAWLTLLTTVVAFVLWYGAVLRLGVARAGLLVGLMPVAALAASVSLGHESLGPIQALGTALVGTGVALGLTQPRRRIALRPALAS